MTIEEFVSINKVRKNTVVDWIKKVLYLGLILMIIMFQILQESIIPRQESKLLMLFIPAS